MGEPDNELIIIQEPRRPLLIVACLRVALFRVFRVARPPWTIRWRDTATEIVARFLFGLPIGAGISLLLFPLIFWPGRSRSRTRIVPSLYEQMGWTIGVGWIFLGIILTCATLWALSTRASVRYLTDEAAGKQVFRW
jgi:hypothetical protein